MCCRCAVVPARSYAVWQGMNVDANPPHFAWPNWLTYKWVEALPLMRAMCGDDANLDVEQAMMQALVDRIWRKGLLYYPPVSPIAAEHSLSCRVRPHDAGDGGLVRT